MINVKRLYKKIEKYKVISFDIFDTLVKRNVSTPEEIFDIVQSEYNKKNFKNRISDFKNLRIKAEKQARNRQLLAEITLDEIYSLLEMPNKKQLEKLEVQTELECCVPNVKVKELYDLCVKRGHIVVITSDMYLSREIIEKILCNCGIIGYKKLYLSSDVKKQKRTGELFDFMISDLGVEPQDIIHIGDRKKTDNLIPRFKKMGSLYIPPFIKNTSFLKKKEVLGGGILYPFINNMLPNYEKMGDVFKWGYESFGPLLLGFCTWIHEQLRNKKIDKAYFLARDMNLVIKTYQMLYNDCDVMYLEISRRSLRELFVRKSGSLKAVFDTMTRKTYTIAELVEILNFQWKDVDGILNKGGYRILPDEKIDSNHEFPEWFDYLDKALFDKLSVRPDYSEDYLQQMGLFAGGSYAIIDIGWHGTIQNMLETILGCKLVGLYFGNTKRSYFAEMDMSGYWFDLKNENDALSYMAAVNIIEVMLFEQIGTTVGYTKEDGRILPVYNNCEMRDYSLVRDFQDGAKTFIKDYIKFDSDINIIKSSDAVLAYSRLAFNPTLQQSKKLAILPYEEGKIYYLAKKHSFVSYLLKPKMLIADYAAAKWKEAFIKQLLPFVIHTHKIDVLIKRRRL